MIDVSINSTPAIASPRKAGPHFEGFLGFPFLRRRTLQAIDIVGGPKEIEPAL
jgi:hypothetical protein